MKEKKRKIKILAYCDSPAISTGFAQVSKKVLGALHDTGKYEIIVAGINHFDPVYDKNKVPYMILGDRDPMSTNTFINLLVNWDYDILWTLQDLGITARFIEVIEETRKKREGNGIKPFKWITYSPVDTTELLPESFLPFVHSDIPVCYTQFGYDLAIRMVPELAEKLSVIYHGADKDFQPIGNKSKFTTAKYKQDFFRAKPETFVVMNINRNQWRKDMWRTMIAFKMFKYEDPNNPKDTKLYIHAKVVDEGGGLQEYAKLVGLIPLEDIVFVHMENEAQGVSREDVIKRYQASDVVISTSKAEGWGLSTTEAFSTKRPVVMPRNTAFVEIIGENEERGYLADSGTNISEWNVDYGKSMYPRPLTNIQSMVDKLNLVYKDFLASKGTYKDTPTGEKIENAYEFARKYSWENVCEEWIKLFDSIS